MYRSADIMNTGFMHVTALRLIYSNWCRKLGYA